MGQSAWFDVNLASGCMAGLEATDVPAGDSRLFSLKVLAAEAISDGTSRVDLNLISWLSDPDVVLDAEPLPQSDRLSEEFQIVIEDDQEEG